MPQRLLMHGISCKTGDADQGTAPVLLSERAQDNYANKVYQINNT